MRALAPRVLRALCDGLQEQLDGKGTPPDTLLREWVAALEGALRPKRGLAQARKGRVAKRDERWAATDRVRELVMARADGHCEACRLRSPALQMDHFFSGSGRRLALEFVETCWGICAPCHRLKTRNEPNAGWWLQQFMTHASVHGYVEAGEMAAGRLYAITATREVLP